MTRAPVREPNVTNPGSYDVDFPESNFRLSGASVWKLIISQSAGMHDMARLSVTSKTLDWYDTLAPSAPIRISWGARTPGDPRSDFFGYVTHVKPFVRNERNFEFEVYAVSATRPLRLTGQEVWRDVTASEVVSRVGRRFKLGPIVARHPLRMTQVSQSGKTYWELLQELAEMAGYALTYRQGRLMFLPLDVLVAQGISDAPTLSDLITGSSQDGGASLRVTSLESATGLTNEGSARYSADPAEVIGVNPVTGDAFSTRSSPGSALRRRRVTTSPYPRYLEGKTAHTRQEAKILAASEARKGLMAIDANVECAGSSSLYPFRPVYLESRSPSMSGWWIVKSVEHTFSRRSGNYMASVILSTDSLSRSTLPKRVRRAYRNFVLESAVGGRSPSKPYMRLERVKPTTVTGKLSGVVDAFRWVAV